MCVVRVSGFEDIPHFGPNFEKKILRLNIFDEERASIYEFASNFLKFQLKNLTFLETTESLKRSSLDGGKLMRIIQNFFSKTLK